MQERKIGFLGTLLIGVMLVSLSAPAFGQPCDTAYNDANGPRNLFLNIHNCGLDCWLQEMPYVESVKEGISGVRVAPVTLDRTTPGDPAFFTVNDFDPYFTDLFETFGPEKTLVLIDDGVDEGPFAKPSPNDILRKLTSLLARTPAVRHVEFMNEPLNFSNIGPEEYVARYLRPARALIDRFNADRAANNQILLYSAAWIGTNDGIRRTRRMIRAGGLAYVDVISVHIYERRAAEAVLRATEYKRMARGKPIAVTETNFNTSNSSNYDTQQWWICESITGMENVLRRGLTPQQQALQAQVLYTLRADEPRQFNIIRFPDAKTLNWTTTGPGHFVINERSKVPTDPKAPAPSPDEPEEPEEPEEGDDAPPATGRRPGRGG